MAGGPPHGPFSMPMMRDFVPEKLRPWFYVFMAITFQLSGGLYAGQMEHWMGETQMMREDFMMCIYCNLGGMAIYFPLLFRMKFCFTNKTLLTCAVAVVLLCNLVAPHITFLPLLWLVCFVEGIAKLQGTFECISNLHGWLAPSGKFSQFFCKLHIFILVSVQMSSCISAYLAYYYHWHSMHWLIIALMLVDLIILYTFVRHFRIMPKLPLFGIDWLGGVLWAVAFMQFTFICNYGDYYDWWNSDVISIVAGTSVATLCVAIGRMISIRHPYYAVATFKYRHFWQLIVLLAMMHFFAATSHSLETIFLGAGLHYDSLTMANLDVVAIVGILIGLAFCYVWMFRMGRNAYHMIAVSLVTMAIYLGSLYFMISPGLNIEKLYLPIVMRGITQGIMSAGLMTVLQSLMPFEHFFQGLSLFNAVNMHFGGALAGAIYTKWISHFMADNISRYSGNFDAVAMGAKGAELQRYLQHFITDMQLVSLKQVYGITLILCLALLIVILMMERRLFPTSIKMIPEWRSVGYRLKRSFSSHDRRDVIQ